MIQLVLALMCVAVAVVFAAVLIGRAFASRHNPCEGCVGCPLKPSKGDAVKSTNAKPEHCPYVDKSVKQ